MENTGFGVYLPCLSSGLHLKSVLTCDCETWVFHAGILSLSLPSCENFEKGLEKEQDEWFSLVDHSSILISLPGLLFYLISSASHFYLISMVSALPCFFQSPS